MTHHYKNHNPDDAVRRVSQISHDTFMIDPKCPLCGNEHVELIGTVSKNDGKDVVTNVQCENGHQFAYVYEYKGGRTLFSVITLESKD
jgi:hypothetical protein